MAGRWVTLLSVLALTGCAEPRLPVTWVPLDEAGTEACVIARQAVEGDRGLGPEVWAAVRAEARRSDRANVRAWGESLGREVDRPAERDAGREIGSRRDVPDAGGRPDRAALSTADAITGFYEQCPSGFTARASGRGD